MLGHCAMRLRFPWKSAATALLVLGLALSACLHYWKAPREVLAGELFRSAQLSRTELEELLERHAIRSVISLRSLTSQDPDWLAERELCAQRGIELQHVPMSPSVTPSRALAQRLLEALERAPRPVLVHCEEGADRTGFACVLEFAALRGEPLDQAIAQQMSLATGHFKLGRAGALDRFFDEYRREAGGRSLRAWIEAGAADAQQR